LEQIKTTACINDQPVKLLVSCWYCVGPDGATHQMLKTCFDASITNMVVIAPGDSIEAEKALGQLPLTANQVICD